jgi:hypothetical protein
MVSVALVNFPLRDFACHMVDSLRMTFGGCFGRSPIKKLICEGKSVNHNGSSDWLFWRSIANHDLTHSDGMFIMIIFIRICEKSAVGLGEVDIGL